MIKKLYINNTLYHQVIINKKAKVKALLEDYSFLISALLKAYDYSLQTHYLTFAKKLTNEAINKFYKDKKWNMSDDDFILKTDAYDSAYKSSLSIMIDNILKVAVLSDDLDMQDIAKQSFDFTSSLLSKNPSSASWLLRSHLAYKNGYIVLKARKDMLKDKEIPNIPFLIKKVNTDEKYLACKIAVCFSYSDSFEEIIKKIKKEANYLK